MAEAVGSVTPPGSSRDPGSSGLPTPATLERERVLAALADLVAAAADGAGGGLLVTGGPGLGRTTIADHAARLGVDRGLQVRRASGADSEQAFSWGVVVQLLGEVAHRGPEEVFSGAAGLAREVLLRATAPDGDPFPALHGLHWLVASLAEASPQLLVVDDAHWADALSLRWVCYLLRRVADLPIAVVLTADDRSRPEPDSKEVVRLLAELTTVATVEPLRPLSRAAMVRLARDVLPEASDDFVDSAVDLGDGNPLVLQQVAQAARMDGAPLRARGAVVLDAMGARELRDTLLLQVGRLGAAAVRVAAAVAVLGRPRSIATVAALAQLDVDATATVLDELVDAGVLDGGPAVSFRHPSVRDAVLGDLGPARRGRLHVQAAQVLREAGASARDIVAHLLRGDPEPSDWAVLVLGQAAADAVAAGAPAEAVPLLDAALARASPEDSPHLLVALGSAEAAAGSGQAAIHLRQACRQPVLEQLDVPDCAQLGDALYAMGLFGEAATAYQQGIRPGSDAPPGLRARLLAGADMAIQLSGSPSQLVADAIGDVDGAPGTAEDRLLAACAAGQQALGVADTLDGEPADRERILALAEYALTDPDVVVQAGQVLVEPLALGLIVAGAHSRAVAMLDRAVGVEEGRGRAGQVAVLRGLRAIALLHLGRLAEAQVDGLDAIRLGREQSPDTDPPTTAAARWTVTVAALAAGQATRAVEVAVHAPPPAVEEPLVGWHHAARGEVALSRGRMEEAVTDLRRAGELFVLAGGSAVFCDWRSGLSLALAGLGDHEGAARTAQELMRHAEALGAPGPRAAARLALARQASGQGEAVEQLQQARDIVAGSEDRLRHTEVLVALGAARRRAGDRRAARKLLEEAVEAASRIGASALAEHAAHELALSGARRPDRPRFGVQALTPAELRVAMRAASGETNREIAERLFVSRKTVETHLSSAYRKLDITARDELATALEDVMLEPDD